MLNVIWMLLFLNHNGGSNGVSLFQTSKHVTSSIYHRTCDVRGILRGKTATHWITDTCHMLHVTCYIMLPTFIQIKQTDQNKCCDEINDTQTHTPCAHANPTTHTLTPTPTHVFGYLDAHPQIHVTLSVWWVFLTTSPLRIPKCVK